MENKSNNTLDMKTFPSDKLIPVWTSKNDWSETVMTNVGTGVILYENKYAEISTGNKVTLLVPQTEYWLDASKPVSRQSEHVKKCLFDDFALQVLFHGELETLNRKLGAYTEKNHLSGEKFLELQKSEMEIFYNRRKKLLCDLDSVESLVAFIQSQLSDGGIDKASAYLSWCGICGVYAQEEQFDYLAYDLNSCSIRKS